MPRFLRCCNEISLNANPFLAPVAKFNLVEPGRKTFMRTIAITAVILFSVIGTVAQTNKGAISGVVVDPNRAAVPGAIIPVTNIGTGQKLTAITGDSGSFS